MLVQKRTLWLQESTFFGPLLLSERGRLVRFVRYDCIRRGVDGMWQCSLTRTVTKHTALAVHQRLDCERSISD